MDSSDSVVNTSKTTFRRQRSVTFAEQTDTIAVDSDTHILNDSVSEELNSKLGSVEGEYLPTPKFDESTPLLLEFTKGFVESQTNEIKAETKITLIQNEGSANWISGAFLLMTAALGAGLLNYPVAYDRIGGITLSTIAQIIILFILASTMLILIYCSELNQDYSYHEVLRSMCGRRTQQMAAFTIMSSCLGICITFLIVIGDQFDRIFATFIGPQFCYNWYFNRSYTISMTALICIWPMSYFKRIDFLRHFNMLGVFAMLYVVFINVYEYYKLDTTSVQTRTHPESIVGVFAVLPVMCFAYQTHEIVVPVYGCMSDRRVTSFTKSIALALSILLILYCISGTFGYLTFGSNVSADIMQMYNPEDPIVAAGIIALIVKMIATYPQAVFCGRDTFVKLFFKESIDESIRKEFWYRISITTAWNSIVLILSIVTPNITISIGFLGSLATCNSLIFPGLCMASLARHMLNLSSNYVFFNKCLFIYGLLVVVLGAFMFVNILIQAINDIQQDYEVLELCK